MSAILQSAIFQAVAMSAGLLFPVVILSLLATIAAVRRGEAGAHHGGEVASDPAHAAEAETSTGPKLPFMPGRDPTVLEILILGAVVFTITMGLFLGYSVLSQM